MPTCNPEDYLPQIQQQQAEADGPTLESINEFHLERTAHGLASRERYQSQEITEGNADLELQLRDVQQQLSRSTDSIEQMKLAAQAEQIATQLVSAPVEVEEPEVDAASDLVSQYGEESVNKTLEWASENLDEEVSQTLNLALEQNDDDAHVAFATIRQIQTQNLPRHEGDFQRFDASISSELTATYGVNGDKVARVNEGLATGKLTKSEAIAYMVKNPAVLQTAMAAAQAGLITLAF